jgi:hypothetical protein
MKVRFVVIHNHVLVFVALVVAVGEAVVEDAAGMLAGVQLCPPILLQRFFSSVDELLFADCTSR